MHLVAKPLASGLFACYAYAWRGGPMIARSEGKTREDAMDAVRAYLGTPEGLAKLSSAQDAHAAMSQSRAPSVQFISGIVYAYLNSPEYENLKPRTKRDYRGILDDFRAEFGDWRVSLFESPRIAQDMSEWRDEHPSPRRGDMRMSVVSLLFSWARSRGITSAQPTEPIKRIYNANRSDKIWTGEDMRDILDAANPSLANAIMLAVETGLRQGDLIALPWTAVNDVFIRTSTSKRGRDAVIPITTALRDALAQIPRQSPIVLTSEHGKPWTGSGLRSSFHKAKLRAGITKDKDLRWHDFRGTAVTRLHKHGLTTRDLARIFAWSETKIEAILERYVSQEAMVEDMLSRMSGEQKCKLLVNRSKRDHDNDR